MAAPSVGSIIKGLPSLRDRRRSSPRDQRLPLAGVAEALPADERPGSEMMAMPVVIMVGFLLARQLAQR